MNLTNKFIFSYSKKFMRMINLKIYKSFFQDQTILEKESTKFQITSGINLLNISREIKKQPNFDD